MTEENEQIEMKLINRLQWRSFKKSFLRLFADDPELIQASRIVRFFLFRMIRKNAENYYCYHNRKHAGLLSLRTDKGSEVFIYGIAVLPDFRRQGLGKFMMNFTENRAKELNKDYLSLAVVAANEPAINLYEKLGYNFLGEGVSFLTISINQIPSFEENPIRLEPIKTYSEEIKQTFAEILLEQIESVSDAVGVGYIKENRLNGYHQQIEKSIKKTDIPFMQIIEKNTLIGFLFCRHKKTILTCSTYLQLEKYNLEFLSKLAEKIKKEITKERDFKTLKFRLSLHQTNNLLDFEKFTFERDSSQDKYMMFKKL